MLAYILSLPRSGSTVLTSLLDQREGVVSPPESSFPQILGVLTCRERQDPRMLAALYIASTFPGTPLNLDEAEACMCGDDPDILIQIGRALATKLGRDTSKLHTILWKTTRTIGMNAMPIATGGRFIVLHRHPHNVFESQFRVHFGANNRRPWRFAMFRESYEYAFSKLPSERTLHVEYDTIPRQLPTILQFLGIDNNTSWTQGSSALAAVAANRPWLSQIMETFENRDPEKRARLDPRVTKTLDRCISITSRLRPFLAPLRTAADYRTLGHIRVRSNAMLKGESSL
jgi:hypothetical protein